MTKIPIEVSARHVHVAREDLDILFGQGYQLTPIKDLSQKGQYASEERVKIKTPKNEISDVRILGPERKLTQVEITKSDAYLLGIDPPIAECSSCAGEGGAEVTIVGSQGEVKKNCAIIAHRHIHLSPEESKKYNLEEGELISVKVKGLRPVTFHQVLIRVDPSFVFHMHLDTDEANAAGIQKAAEGKIIK